jgi:hypothetical protein
MDLHGVLAPNAKLRREIVPSPPEQATAPACDHAPARMSWTRLLKRVFDIDIDHCPSGKRFNREIILRARVGGMAYNIPAA